MNVTLPPIIVDTREQAPLVFPPMVQLKRGTLKTGDYSILGYEDQFTVERKSLPDLVNTIIHERERFERELERMRQFSFRRLLVTVPYADVSTGAYSFSRANPRSVIASVNAFEIRYGVPAVFAADSNEASHRLLNWAYYFVREIEKAGLPSWTLTSAGESCTLGKTASQDIRPDGAWSSGRLHSSRIEIHHEARGEPRKWHNLTTPRIIPQPAN